VTKLHEIVVVVGMNGKKQELPLNPHSAVGWQLSLGGGSLITLLTGNRSKWRRARSS
jgi:hypothetical protein